MTTPLVDSRPLPPLKIEWPAATRFAPPLAGEVHICALPLEIQPATREAAKSVLAGDELTRAARFHFERDHNHYVAARAGLRCLLAQCLRREPAGIFFRYRPQGKPELAEGGLHFNLAHSHGLALYALTSEKAVGVDVEWVRPLPDLEDIARRCFAVGEQASLHRLPEASRPLGFFHCWTRKEAFIKALGEGLSHPLDSFCVSLEPAQPARLLSSALPANAPATWSLVHLEPAAGFVGALAAPFPTLRVHLQSCALADLLAA